MLLLDVKKTIPLTLFHPFVLFFVFLLCASPHHCSGYYITVLPPLPDRPSVTASKICKTYGGRPGTISGAEFDSVTYYQVWCALPRKSKKTCKAYCELINTNATIANSLKKKYPCQRADNSFASKFASSTRGKKSEKLCKFSTAGMDMSTRPLSKVDMSQRELSSISKKAKNPLYGATYTSMTNPLYGATYASKTNPLYERIDRPLPRVDMSRRKLPPIPKEEKNPLYESGGQ